MKTRIVLTILFALLVGLAVAQVPYHNSVVWRAQQWVAPSAVYDGPPLTNLYLWWHAADLTDGAVSSWTNRMFPVTLTQNTASLQPSKSGSNVVFTSDQLTNKATSFTTSVGYLWFIVLYRNAGSAFVISPNGSALYPDWQMSGNVVYYQLDGANFLAITNPMPPNGVKFDIATASSTHNGPITNYFNSTRTTGTAGPWFQFDVNSITVGSAYNATQPFAGAIYDIIAYTNLGSWAASETMVSNLHWWQTNYYGP